MNNSSGMPICYNKAEEEGKFKASFPNLIIPKHTVAKKYTFEEATKYSNAKQSTENSITDERHEATDE